MTELEALRKRVKHQRRELRILNKQLRAFWRGWHFHGQIMIANEQKNPRTTAGKTS